MYTEEDEIKEAHEVRVGALKKENERLRAEDVLNELKGKLAGIADVLNQELRENHGDQYQIKNYLFTDFRPVICKLVDLCKEHSSKQ